MLCATIPRELVTKDNAHSSCSHRLTTMMIVTQLRVIGTTKTTIERHHRSFSAIRKCQTNTTMRLGRRFYSTRRKIKEVCARYNRAISLIQSWIKILGRITSSTLLSRRLHQSPSRLRSTTTTTMRNLCWFTSMAVMMSETLSIWATEIYHWKLPLPIYGTMRKFKLAQVLSGKSYNQLPKPLRKVLGSICRMKVWSLRTCTSFRPLCRKKQW